MTENNIYFSLTIFFIEHQTEKMEVFVSILSYRSLKIQVLATVSATTSWKSFLLKEFDWKVHSYLKQVSKRFLHESTKRTAYFFQLNSQHIDFDRCQTKIWDYENAQTLFLHTQLFNIRCFLRSKTVFCLYFHFKIRYFWVKVHFTTIFEEVVWRNCFQKIWKKMCMRK